MEFSSIHSQASSSVLIACKMSTKRSRAKASGSEFNSIKMWDQMAWRSVDVAKENLGDYEDTVFFGLEELDGNAYKLMKTEQVRL